MLKLIHKHPKVLLFGMLTAMFSGPGQTFLVSIFIPHMRDELGMNQTGIASLYSLATLGSALILPFSGKLLDRIHLISFSLAAGILLAAGCLVLSQSYEVMTVFVGFLLIRNLGQGTLTLISSTTMARIFGKMRGKALSIASLGYPLSEAVFPYAVSSWIILHGWRSGWIMLATLTLLFFSPAVFLLLRDHPQDRVPRDFDEVSLEGVNSQEVSGHSGKDWKLGEVLKDHRYYLLQVSMLIPPAFLTGLFFHQGIFADWKGWSVQTIALAFIAFAICRAALSFLLGPLIDRYSAKKLFPLSSLPLAFGIFCLIVGGREIWSFAYLTGCGLSMGFAMTVSSALWAELYGTKFLGSIRGVQTSVIVFSTAVVPPVMGVLFDNGAAVVTMLWSMIALIAVGAILAGVVCYLPPSKR